jgi:hypothetical protein
MHKLLILSGKGEGMSSSGRFRRNYIFILVAIASVGTWGCAHLTFETVQQWREPWYKRWISGDDGIHYYRPKPYLLVTESLTEKPRAAGGKPEKTESCVAEIKYLPDYTQEYVIVPHYWLGSVALKPTLADGWNLTNFDSTVDTKVPETITAFANLAKAAAPGGVTSLGAGLKVTPAPPSGNVSPGLYAIVPSGNGLALDTEHPVFVAKGTICSTLTAPQPTKTPSQTTKSSP